MAFGGEFATLVALGLLHYQNSGALVASRGWVLPAHE